jgi:hypothetical protein
MGRRDSRIAKMIDISTSLAAFRHNAMLMTEGIMMGDDPTKQKQDWLDRLRSTIEKLETALEMERGLGTLKVIASGMSRLEEAP